MIFTHWLVLFSALFSILGSSVYIRDTLKGQTKPNRASWFMWALAPLVGTAAALPTIRKAWYYPQTETGLTYILGLISALLVIPSIPVWNIENSAFQIYLLVINICLISAVYRKRLGFKFKLLYH